MDTQHTTYTGMPSFPHPMEITMPITLAKITSAQHESAIEWLACVLPGQSTDHFTPQQCYRMIKGWYDGGWGGFLFDLGYVQCSSCGKWTADWDAQSLVCPSAL